MRMRRFLNFLIVIPLALILVVFAVANRHFVTVSFDPFNTIDPSLAVSMPLFVLIILVAILGVVAGGCATWLGQRHWRRAARRHEADARDVKAQLADLRAATASRAEPARLAGPTEARFYAPAGRDKQGVTL
jgi:uncharacterized integral membrane protein